ncbi:hypothetical protein P820_01622 [Klebsiella pneumoniae UCI 17]|nr:lF-82 [Klebsiella variicola]KEC97945.1 hypothetical protein P820_01622 [Klebsiella pneumoniae UCI 17]
MRKSRTPGSVRGVSGNGYPYRDILGVKIMGGKDRNYTVVYRGDFIDAVPDGRWMMIQRGKEYGGGYWFGRAYADCFWLEFERPMPLSSCVEYVVLYDHVAARAHEFEDEFKLE